METDRTFDLVLQEKGKSGNKLFRFQFEIILLLNLTSPVNLLDLRDTMNLP